MNTQITKFKAFSMILTVILLMATFSCASWEGSSKQTKGTVIGTGAGAAVGAGLGAVLGGNRRATLAGAGIGALVGGIAGNQMGAYMDRQEQALQEVAARSEAISIQRSQDVLTATFKADMMFDVNSATIKPGAYSEIDNVARILQDYPETQLRVAGHTDQSGSETYNQQLSERRAMAVKNALIQRGVADYRIQAIGFGESMPISSNAAMNRRVEIRITPVEQR
ncbi:MAG: OmpA family protein [Desulfosalsimonadaceae bacterium]|nr:OmpA family protein [Desulfosalsimonadaceae bacterium]